MLSLPKHLACGSNSIDSISYSTRDASAALGMTFLQRHAVGEAYLPSLIKRLNRAEVRVHAFFRIHIQ